MLTLTPNIYKKNMQLSLLSKNKIDTVNIHPISNATVENKVFHTEEINVVTIGNTQHELPISDSVQPTHLHTSSNTTWGSLVVGTEDFAKARVDCVMVSGKTRCVSETVIQGEPQVTVRLVGQSKKVARGGSTFESYPGISTLNNIGWSLSSWIENNKTETTESLTVDYTGKTIPLNPWVRNFVEYSLDTKPSANDVITDWMSSGASGRITLWWQNWSEGGNIDLSAYPSIRMQSPSTVSMSVEKSAGTTLSLHNVQLNMSVTIARIDDYTYDVTWTVPVRIAYAAASRTFGIFGGEEDADNYAFVDKITKIVLELSGTPYSTDTLDLSYGLDSHGTLTSIISNNYPIDIDAEEALTQYTHYGDRDKNVFNGVYFAGQMLALDQNIVTEANSFVTDYMWFRKNDILIAPVFTQGNPVMGWKYNEKKEFTGSLTGGISGDIIAYIMSADQYIRLNGDIAKLNSGNYYVTLREKAPWVEVIAEQLLTKYKDGKYTCKCTITATWAERNNVKIDTEVQVKLYNGKMVTRKGTVCTFKIKNITRRYSREEFVYDITLLEV